MQLPAVTTFLRCQQNRSWTDLWPVPSASSVWCPTLQNYWPINWGLHFDGVKTHKMADMGSMSRPFNAEESALMQQMVNQGYALFTKRCAEGRNIPLEELCKIAEGVRMDRKHGKGAETGRRTGGDWILPSSWLPNWESKDYKLKSYPTKQDFRQNCWIPALTVTFTASCRKHSVNIIKVLNGCATWNSLTPASRLPFNMRIQ